MDDQWTIDKMWAPINVTMWRCFDIFVGFLNRAHMVFPAYDIGKLMRCTEFGVARNKFGLANWLNHSHDIRKKRPVSTLSICISLALSLSLLVKSITRIDDALLWMLLWLTSIKHQMQCQITQNVFHFWKFTTKSNIPWCKKWKQKLMKIKMKMNRRNALNECEQLRESTNRQANVHANCNFLRVSPNKFNR